MASLLTMVSSCFTTVIGMVGTVASTIVGEGNEILALFVVAVPLVGIGVGMFKRLIRL